MMMQDPVFTRDTVATGYTGLDVRDVTEEQRDVWLRETGHRQACFLGCSLEWPPSAARWRAPICSGLSVLMWLDHAPCFTACRAFLSSPLRAASQSFCFDKKKRPRAEMNNHSQDVAHQGGRE